MSGLRYLPRQDGNPNGTIGRYTVTVSTDGTTFSEPVATGEFYDSPTEKPVRFPPVTARLVRLTAITEAGNRGPWSSAADIRVLGVNPRAAYAGEMGSDHRLPDRAGLSRRPADQQAADLLRVRADGLRHDEHRHPGRHLRPGDRQHQPVQSSIDVGHQMFCSGLTLLTDGRVLINGGSSDSATTIYDPFANTWTRGPLMTIPRAYQGNTLLSDGRVFTIGGSWHRRGRPQHGEVWTPTARPAPGGG